MITATEKASVRAPARRSSQSAAMIPTRSGPFCHVPCGCSTASAAAAAVTPTSAATRRRTGTTVHGCALSVKTRSATSARRIDPPRPCRPGWGLLGGAPDEDKHEPGDPEAADHDRLDRRASAVRAEQRSHAGPVEPGRDRAAAMCGGSASGRKTIEPSLAWRHRPAGWRTCAPGSTRGWRPRVRPASR